MSFQAAKDEYALALRNGQKEYRELVAAGKPPHPLVLEEVLPDVNSLVITDVGLVDIPSQRIIGTKSAGRITAFTPTFRPLLKAESEFAMKWTHLCAAHLSDAGIREPIVCYEYLGDFYVQEGNKRVSVLRNFGAPRIPGIVKRVIPAQSDDPRIKAYFEFLEFYKHSKLYTLQFRRPGDYAKLLAQLDMEPGQNWTEDQRRTFNAYYTYFLDALDTLNRKDETLPEEALLLWLQIHSYQELGTMSAMELKRSLVAMWPDVLASTQKREMTMETEETPETKPKLLNRIMGSTPDHINVAFVHQLDLATSGWVQGHEQGRAYIEEIFGDKITVRSYFGANHAAEAEATLEQAVAEGADVIFTTAPKLIRATLKYALKYPKVSFFNCSVDQPYSSVTTYYGRIFEAKFISGAIAGAMAQNDRIGYMGSNPILGVPASINAFALGAQMTNPRAQIELRWSCCAGDHQADFFSDGIRVMSNRDVPTKDRMYLEFCNYGTYLMDDQGSLIPLASPVWLWGKFYETVIRSILAGSRKEDKSNPKAVNYWLGMDSGVIDIELGEKLPAGVRMLAEILQKDMRTRSLNPFFRKVVAQDGTLKNDGSRRFTPEELLHMDYLVENVAGSIPTFDEILPDSQSIVRKLGIYRDSIPATKETVL